MKERWDVVLFFVFAAAVSFLALSFVWPPLAAWRLPASAIGAAAFGYLYDRAVAYIEDRWPENDNTADLVVLGVAVVLLLAGPLMGLQHTAYLFGMFAASGFFMAVGSKRRYNERRRKADGRIRADIREIVEKAQGKQPYDDA